MMKSNEVAFEAMLNFLVLAVVHFVDDFINTTVLDQRVACQYMHRTLSRP